MRKKNRKIILLLLAVWAQGAIPLSDAQETLLEKDPAFPLQMDRLQQGAIQISVYLPQNAESGLQNHPAFRLLNRSGVHEQEERPRLMLVKSAFVVPKNIDFFLGEKAVSPERIKALMDARSVQEAAPSEYQVSLPIDGTPIDIKAKVKIRHFSDPSSLPSELRELAQSEPVIRSEDDAALTLTEASEFSGIFSASGGITQYRAIGCNQTLVVNRQLAWIKDESWKNLAALRMILWKKPETQVTEMMVQKVAKILDNFNRAMD